jgi:hypothetical protein
MRRTKPGISPNLDVLESREVLSTAAPFLSQHALIGVVRDVRSIMGNLARTHDTAQASLRLDRLSARIPHGPEALAPSWQSDLGLYQPGISGSIPATQRRILGDLRRYLQAGSAGVNPPVTGSGSTVASPPPAPGAGGMITPKPTPAPSLDSVRIENTTGLALQVTIFLETANTPQPFLTEIIPAQGNAVALFDFGSETGAFMTMNISRADGIFSPSPFDGVSLSQPMTGYNGALFDISLFSFYFNVTPL